ncbi:MAG: hypothetical protein HYV14_10030 [Elusimicrobia bacterium]|nr:hypothetical protein [Elusimicrobiota bacterium]
MSKRGSAALAGAIALIYAPALVSPVIYDDVSHVRDNPAFRLGLGEFLSGLFSRDYFLFAAERTYQPAVTLFHYATHSFPLIYRSFGLCLHFLNAVLLYRVAQRLDAGRRPAIYAACLFAFFPAHTELLNFSSFKGHLFAASCILAVLLSVIEYCADKDHPSPFKICFFLALGLLSKESALVAVPISILYVVLFARAELPRLKTLAAAVAALSAVYLVLRFSVLTPPRAFPVRFEYSSLESFSFYLRTLAVPYPLCLERTLPSGPWWPLWLGVFAAAAVLLRRSKEGLFSLAWIPLALAPFLHLIPFSNVSPVADRYLYLPAAGLCLLLAHLLGRSERGAVALAALLALWVPIAAARNLTYRSTRALFEQTASCAPNNARAQFLLGMICFQEKDYAASRAAYERVLALTDSPGARAALADIERAEAALE